MANELKTNADIKTFLLAGKALFTVENTITSARFTFQVRKAKANPKFPGDTWFVGVLTGTDNENDYSSLGMVKDGTFRTYGKARVTTEATSFKAFSWLFARINGDKPVPENVIVRHEGYCCRCGRTLTVPDSIDRLGGLGPECAKLMGWKKESASPVASPNPSTTFPSSVSVVVEQVIATVAEPVVTLDSMRERMFLAYAPGESTGPRFGISSGS